MKNIKELNNLETNQIAGGSLISCTVYEIDFFDDYEFLFAFDVTTVADSKYKFYKKLEEMNDKLGDFFTPKFKIECEEQY